MRAFIFLLGAVFIFTGCEKKDPFIPDYEPIAYYNFNGHAYDQSKYKNDGSVHNAILTADSLGDAAGAFQFDNSYIEVPDNPLFHFKSNALTVSAWIKPLNTSDSYIVQKTNTVFDDGQISQGGGPFCLDIFPGTARALLYSADTFAILTGTTGIKKNSWQHLALTWNGRIASLYYNGHLEATAPFEEQLLETNGNIYIGAYKFVFPTASFKGSIDNVRIYNRSLTAGEIGGLYFNYK